MYRVGLSNALFISLLISKLLYTRAVCVCGGVRKRDIVNSLRSPREGEGWSGDKVNLFCPLPPPHTHASTFTAAVNSVGWMEEGGSPSFPPSLLPSQYPYLTYTAATKLSQQTVQNTEYGIQNTEYRNSCT
jgi:hypothetical protein